MFVSWVVRALRWWLAAAFVSTSLLGCGGGGDPQPTSSAKALALATTGVPPETGVWWNPAESGKGYVLERQGNAVLMGSYMYESSGAPVWYLSALALQYNGSYSGALIRSSGGQTLDGAYRPPAGSTQVATVTLTAQTARAATLVIQPSDGGPAITTPLERFAFSTPAFAPSTATFESGLWWNEAESGRGFFVEVQGAQAVMGSYMYDASGQPVWYLSTGVITHTGGTVAPATQTFGGALIGYGGGQTLTGPYRAPFVTGSPGNITFTATSATTASVSLPNGTIVPLRRFLPADPVGSGELKSATLLNTIAVTDIVQALGAADVRIQNVNPVYAVTSYRLEYLTSDAQGQPVLASGLVSVPVKPQGAASPVLSYQHGTMFQNAEAPSNHAVPSEISVILASLGYIVVAPDFVGYGTSVGTPHPYLLAAPSAAVTVDFLTAAGTWRQKAGVSDNAQLFMIGYSEGAYVTMAAHRAMQAGKAANLAPLRVVVTGAGPYNVQVTFDALLARVRQEFPLLGALINPGFLRFLGPSIRAQVRDQLLKLLLPSDTDVVFDVRSIDYYLADDVQALAQLSNVHDWKPSLPVRLFHGRDDQTVPYASSLSTLQAMQKNGAGALVSLTDCPVVPAGHIACVPSFLSFTLDQLAPVARDLLPIVPTP
jgi:pimeloyl-ACP methyl ester carboxylesterase